MIRILHIVHAITMGGGLCNMIMNYYRFIDRSKIQFDFLYFRESENTFQSEIETLGGRCFRMSEPSINLSFFKEREAFFKTYENEWVAIHCHALFAAAVFARTAKRHKINHICSHSHSLSNDKKNIIKKFRNKYFVRQAKILGDTHLACSRDAAVFMFGKEELQNGKAIVIYNAIDLDSYWFNESARLEIRRKLGIQDKFVIGHVGGLTSAKNQSFLIDIFFRFQQKHPDSVLLLIGGEGIADGSTKNLLKEKVVRYDIADKVKFLGLRNDVNLLDQAMDVFVFPSMFEGLGIVLVEAQASGLPCIVSPAVPDDAHVLNHYVKMDNLNDPDPWVQTIESFINFGLSMRYADHKLFDSFNIRKQCEKLEKIYLGIN